MNQAQDPVDPTEEFDGSARIEQPSSETPVEIENAGLRMALIELREQTLRERAELDNQRRRMVREIENARRFANERLLGELLPVFDSLHAGMRAAGDESHPLKEGLELTLRQLLKTASDNGLIELDPKGQVFNPDRHQAVTQVPGTGSAPGTIIDVFQKGYVLNDRLLRPALVVVASEP